MGENMVRKILKDAGVEFLIKYNSKQTDYQ